MKRLEIEGISKDEFQELLSKEIKAALQEQLKDLKHQQPEEKYLSRAQVCEMLGISLVTLSNWSKSGILKPRGIGNRVFYLQSDIQKKLVPINEV